MSRQPARLAVLLLACLAAPTFAQETAAAPEPNWELKAVSLGATQDQVIAALPNAQCEAESFDAGLVVCRDWDNTLAGRKAVVTVKLLEGKVVYVNVGNIDLAQAKEAAAALVAKYGAPTATYRAEGQTSASNRERGIYTWADAYDWAAGDLHLEILPFAWTNKNKTTYAAVVLRDDALHDRQWIVRYNNKGRKADDI